MTFRVLSNSDDSVILLFLVLLFFVYCGLDPIHFFFLIIQELQHNSKKAGKKFTNKELILNTIFLKHLLDSQCSFVFCKIKILSLKLIMKTLKADKIRKNLTRKNGNLPYWYQFGIHKLIFINLQLTFLTGAF